MEARHFTTKFNTSVLTSNHLVEINSSLPHHTNSLQWDLHGSRFVGAHSYLIMLERFWFKNNAVELNLQRAIAYSVISEYETTKRGTIKRDQYIGILVSDFD